MDQESTTICDRNDLRAAVAAINTRISTLESKAASEAQASIIKNLPVKLLSLETDVLSAIARYQAAQVMQGGRCEPKISVLRLINGNRAEYFGYVESARTELTEELSK